MMQAYTDIQTEIQVVVDNLQQAQFWTTLYQQTEESECLIDYITMHIKQIRITKSL